MPVDSVRPAIHALPTDRAAGVLDPFRRDTPVCTDDGGVRVWTRVRHSPLGAPFQIIFTPLGWVLLYSYPVLEDPEETAFGRFASQTVTGDLLLAAHLPLHVEAVRWIKEATGLSDARIARLLGVSRPTLRNWEHRGVIADVKRQRLYAVREILELAAARQGSPDELVHWLDTPRGADGFTPAKLLEAGEVDRARYLAASSPSPRLRRPPAWLNRPVPPAFQKGAEQRMETLPPEETDVSDALLEEP